MVAGRPDRHPQTQRNPRRHRLVRLAGARTLAGRRKIRQRKLFRKRPLPKIYSPNMIRPFLLLLLFAAPLSAAPTAATSYLDKPLGWFKSPQAAEIASNILSYQSDDGGFPKNIDTAAK